MKSALVVVVSVAALPLPVLAQQQAPAQEPPANFTTPLAGEFTPRISEELGRRPVPRMPDGKPDLSGPWVGGGSNDDMEREGGLKSGELPLLPAARALRDSRPEKDEPYLWCTPMSVPRKNPYPWRFVHSYTSTGPGHLFVIHENGDGGANRQIFMDGRTHPADLLPAWWGHSIGWWDGDTLVIDTIGYNDKFWFDSRGTPHTERLHTIERWTRINYGTLVLDLTLDDPGTFSRPVQLTFTATAVPPGHELMEYVCTENNQYGVADDIKNPLAKEESRGRGQVVLPGASPCRPPRVHRGIRPGQAGGSDRSDLEGRVDESAYARLRGCRRCQRDGHDVEPGTGQSQQHRAPGLDAERHQGG